MNIWRFPEIGEPPVIIQTILGYLHSGKPPFYGVNKTLASSSISQVGGEGDLEHLATLNAEGFWSNGTDDQGVNGSQG